MVIDSYWMVIGGYRMVIDWSLMVFDAYEPLMMITTVNNGHQWKINDLLMKIVMIDDCNW